MFIKQNNSIISHLEDMTAFSFSFPDDYLPRYSIGNDRFMINKHQQKHNFIYNSSELLSPLCVNELYEFLGINLSYMAEDLNNCYRPFSKNGDYVKLKIKKFNESVKKQCNYEDKVANHKKTPQRERLSEFKKSFSYRHMKYVSEAVILTEFINLLDNLNKFDFLSIYNQWSKFSKKNDIDISEQTSAIQSILDVQIKQKKLRNDFISQYSYVKLINSDDDFTHSMNNSMSMIKSSPILKPINEDDISLMSKGFEQFKNDLFEGNLNCLLDIDEILKSTVIFQKNILEIYHKVKHLIEIKDSKDKAVNALKQCNQNFDKLYENNSSVQLIVENMTGIYKNLIVFDDKSCLIKYNNSEHYELLVDYTEKPIIIYNALITYTQYTLRKNPTISNFIINYIERAISQNKLKNLEFSDYSYRSFNKNKITFSSVFMCLSTYFDNEGILKSKNYNFVDRISSYDVKNLELFDDEMYKIIREHKIYQYANSILSSKYKDLYDENTYALFSELFDINISKKVIQEMIGKRIAAFKTTKSLNNNLKIFINSFHDFSLDMVKLKATSNNVEIIKEFDTLIILKIDNFKQSKTLGSNAWCIVRDEHYFNHYISNNAKQYFIYDFSKSSKEPDSLVGITLTNDNRFIAANTKDNGYYGNDSAKKYIDIIESFEKQEKTKDKICDYQLVASIADL